MSLKSYVYSNSKLGRSSSKFKISNNLNFHKVFSHFSKSFSENREIIVAKSQEM